VNLIWRIGIAVNHSIAWYGRQDTGVYSLFFFPEGKMEFMVFRLVVNGLMRMKIRELVIFLLASLFAWTLSMDLK
jgi:hypothetical protein